jgi:hypothetical protein
MIEIRKIITTRETVFSELGVEASRPTTRAVAMTAIRNSFAGQFVEDLRPLFEAGTVLGERLMPELVNVLGGPAVSHGLRRYRWGAHNLYVHNLSKSSCQYQETVLGSDCAGNRRWPNNPAALVESASA